MRSAYFTQPRMIAIWSISWNTCRPNWLIGDDPPIATTGQQSTSALATPVTRLVTPGPEAAMQTEGFCSSRL